MFKSEKRQNIGLKMNNSDMLFENLATTRWLNTKEAATYLGISTNALRIRVHRGQVQAHKLGQRLKFQIATLNAALQKKEV